MNCVQRNLAARGDFQTNWAKLTRQTLFLVSTWRRTSAIYLLSNLLGPFSRSSFSWQICFVNVSKAPSTPSLPTVALMSSTAFFSSLRSALSEHSYLHLQHYILFIESSRLPFSMICKKMCFYVVRFLVVVVIGWISTGFRSTLLFFLFFFFSFISLWTIFVDILAGVTVLAGAAFCTVLSWSLPRLTWDAATGRTSLPILSAVLWCQIVDFHWFPYLRGSTLNDWLFTFSAF